MRLVQVFGRKDYAEASFIVYCKHCGKQTYHDPQFPTYADLDGEAFKDYYCGKCAQIKIEIETAKGERYDRNREVA